MDPVRSSASQCVAETANPAVLANIRWEKHWRQRIRAQLRPFQECIPWGLVIVDRNCRIVFATPYGWALLRADCGLKAPADRLVVERTSVNRAFSELVHSTATRQFATGACGTIIGVPDRQGRTRFTIRLQSFDDEEDDSLVLIAIMDLKCGGQIERSTVAMLFGLSEREAEFAELFSEGHRLQEIAKRMGVALNTARVHLRNVFVKTGSSSQIELARLFTLLPCVAGGVGKAQLRIALPAGAAPIRASATRIR